MRKNTPFLSITVLLLAVGVSAFAGGQTAKKSPEDVVMALYKAHDSHHGPFFQTRSRMLIDKYFDRSLADLIWKDARNAKGEVGALDGDPLYDAQDMEIKDFKISRVESAANSPDKATVSVSFKNFGEKKNLVIILSLVNTTWKISDIKYGEGQHLVGMLKGQ